MPVYVFACHECGSFETGTAYGRGEQPGVLPDLSA